jgi:predicted AlkP superfamily pyrophosphatase or phosphodiesterase
MAISSWWESETWWENETMKRTILFTGAGFALLYFAGTASFAAPASKPKLVVAIAIDQFRYDYLTRFRDSYHAGFARMLENGAVFTDAHYLHYLTVTAIGHSTFLSGAPPSLSGIVGNEWYDRETAHSVTSVSDPTAQLLGGRPGETGSSPRRLLVSTIGDELKISGKGNKVIGISIKDRSAILPAGHMADGAYWFDGATGNWVSSTYYFADLPAWVKDVDQGRPADQYRNAEWMPVDAKPGEHAFQKMGATADAKFYGSLDASPFGNEMIESLAERSVSAEQLGKHSGADLLAVSFSSNDYVGHAKGPDSPEVRDISIRTDRLLGKLFDYLDSQVGRDNWLFILTADHGVAPIPEVNVARKMPGGRVDNASLIATAENALSAKFGAGKWIVSRGTPPIYLNRELIREKKLDEDEVERVAAQALRDAPHVLRVYTREQIVNGRATGDAVAQAVNYGFYGSRSGDLFVLLDPYYLAGEANSTGTNHGTPFNYDTHVPIVFMGAGIHPGDYHRKVWVNDIAPTLATILGIEEPSGSIGNVLTELWTPPPAR